MKGSNSIKSFIWKLGEISFLMAVVYFSGCATYLQTSSKVERTYSDGARYVGEYKYGKRHGQGTMTWPDGMKYVGQWKYGKRHGQGTVTIPDGRKYVGQWRQSKWHGQGTLTWPDGTKYVGHWKYGNLHGQGTRTVPDGRKYVGQWKDGKRHGQGTLTWPDGAKYVGEWKYWNRHGQGTIIWPNGDKFIGSFDGEKNEGIGTFIRSEGQKHAAKLHFRVKITMVFKGTQGEQIGLQVGDIVVEYNDEQVRDINQLGRMTPATNPQHRVSMKILRDGVEKTFTLRGGKVGIFAIDDPYLVVTQKGERFLAGISRIDKAEKKQSAGDVRVSEKEKGKGSQHIYPQLQGWAVIIGISKYKNADGKNLTNLIFADDDAKAFARVLRNLGWSESHMRLLVNEKATQRNIMIALESWLTKAGPDDQIVLFWSGHGFPDPENPEKVYFACHDTDISIPATGYRMDRVRVALEERRARNVVVFADTCHAGKLITRGERAISIMPKIDKMRLEKKTPKGWIFMVGADTDRKAIAYTSWKNGAFTYCLLKALSGKADGYMSSGADDGVVTMGELRTYMNTVMPDETQRVIGVAKRPVITTSTGDPEIWNLTLQAR